MSLTFDAATHRYFWRGQPKPNVTRVLEAAGMLNFGGATEEQLAAARERGTAVHIATELNDRDDLVEESVHESIRPYLAAWRLFRLETGFEPTLIEHRLYSQLYGYAGTMDRAGKWRYELEVPLDIKTGARQKATGPQLAAYSHAWRGGSWQRTPRYAVYLQDDGHYDVVAHTATEDLSAFLAALTLWNWKGLAP